MDELKTMILDYVKREYLEEGDDRVVTEATPLISGGILDSLATVKVVAALEDRYGIEIRPHEASITYFNTIADIAALVSGKL